MANRDRRDPGELAKRTRTIHMGGFRPAAAIKNNVIDDVSVREILKMMEMARQDRHRPRDGKKKRAGTDWRSELKGLFGGG